MKNSATTSTASPPLLLLPSQETRGDWKSETRCQLKAADLVFKKCPELGFRVCRKGKGHTHTLMQTQRERRLTIDSQSGAVGATSSPSPEEAPLESAAPSSPPTTATNFPLLSLFPTFFCLALILPSQSSTQLKIPTTAAQPPKLDTLGIRRCRTSDDVNGAVTGQ
jgi:hypothetical protein